MMIATYNFPLTIQLQVTYSEHVWIGWRLKQFSWRGTYDSVYVFQILILHATFLLVWTPYAMLSLAGILGMDEVSHVSRGHSARYMVQGVPKYCFHFAFCYFVSFYSTQIPN